MTRFTIDFAADTDSDTYDALVIDLRYRLAVGERIENVPSLAPQAAPGGKLEFFDVNMSYTDQGIPFTVQVRFRIDNLYLVGYRAQNSDIWYELGHEDSASTLINEPGITTEILRLGKNYNSLVAAAHIGLDEIPLSSNRIGGAIITLTWNEGSEPSPRARAILTLVFAIVEAARLRDISSLISRA
jgi:hypothetical protein